MAGPGEDDLGYLHRARADQSAHRHPGSRSPGPHGRGAGRARHHNQLHYHGAGRQHHGLLVRRLRGHCRLHGNRCHDAAHRRCHQRQPGSHVQAAGQHGTRHHGPIRSADRRTGQPYGSTAGQSGRWRGRAVATRPESHPATSGGVRIMPTCTPIYGFTYALCSDPPCDIGDTFCEMISQVEAELDRLDEVVNRTVDTIPQFEVSVGAYTFTSSGDRKVAFDAVGVDTDDMVDLTADPFSFPINRTGRWFFYFRVSTNGNTALQGNIPVTVTNTPSLAQTTINQDYQDDGTNYPVPIDGSGFYRYASAGTRVSLTASTAALAIVSAVF